METSAAVSASVQPSVEHWWTPIVDFGIHAVVGTLVFAVIAVPALLLDLAQAHLWTTSPMISAGLQLGEYALFAVDLALFLIFLGRNAWKTARKLWTT